MLLTLTPLVAAAMAFVLAVVLTPLVVRMARRVGAMDPLRPNKIHAREVPRLGGLAIAIGFFVPILGVALRTNLFSAEIYGEPKRAVALLAGGAAILVLGIYDDLRGARAWQKLIVQIPLGALAWWAGIRIGSSATPAGGVVDFSQLVSLVVTVGWVVTVVNAINLIDGLDGLASGLALQALAVVALSAYLRGNAMLFLFGLTLAASVAGFLVHNFHPATIFMGDTGSMFLGWVIALGTVWASQKAATVVGVVLPALALGLPLLDTSLAIWRRLRRRQPVLSGDLDHIHHRLLRHGWSHRRVVITLYCISLPFSAASAYLVYLGDSAFHWPALGIAALAALGLAIWFSSIAPAAPAESS